jgi:TatA/E family protein of Tat protein translocase
MVIVLIVVGPGKLPETGAAIGKAIRGFKDAVDTGDAGKDSTAAQQPMQAQQPYPVQYAPQTPMQAQQPCPVQRASRQSRGQGFSRGDRGSRSRGFSGPR